jgi:hypothetical protein
MWSLLMMGAALANPAADALDAVVLMVQGSSTCAGALVDAQGTVVTAYHCVAPGGRPLVTTRDGMVAVGRVVSVDRRYDLAVVSVPELAGHPWIPVAEQPPALGETVSALGHPFGVREPFGFTEGTLRWSITTGVVSAVGPRVLQFTAAVNPGNSGGPVVDEQGQLVAVVSRRSGFGEGLGFGARASEVRELLAGGPGLGAVGGLLGVYPIVSVTQGSGGLASLGARVEMSFRDRLVLSATERLALSPRWSAVQAGQVHWIGAEGRVAARQRLGRGRYSVRVDAWGAVVAMPGFDAVVGADDIRLVSTFQAAPLVGGQVGMGGGALDVGINPTTGKTTVSMVLNWPGVFSVF